MQFWSCWENEWIGGGEKIYRKTAHAKNSRIQQSNQSSNVVSDTIWILLFSHIFSWKSRWSLLYTADRVIFLAKFMALENPTNGIPFLVFWYGEFHSWLESMEPDTSYNKVEWPFSGEAKRGGGGEGRLLLYRKGESSLIGQDWILGPLACYSCLPLPFCESCSSAIYHQKGKKRTKQCSKKRDWWRRKMSQLRSPLNITWEKSHKKIGSELEGKSLLLEIQFPKLFWISRRILVGDKYRIVNWIPPHLTSLQSCTKSFSSIL